MKDLQQVANPSASNPPASNPPASNASALNGCRGLVRTGRRARRVGRAEVRGIAAAALVVAVLSVSSLASVQAQSTIAQKPLVGQSQPEPNLMLIMDDSGSMDYEHLPAPSDFRRNTFTASFGADNRTALRDMEGNVVTAASPEEVAAWTPGVNGLAYDGGITYRPWNDDNKPAASNFPNQPIGDYSGGSYTNGPRKDMRTVVQGGVRVPVDTSRHDRDPFRRPTDLINGAICLERRMQMENVCVDADPSDDSDEQSCSMQMVNACISWQQIQRPVPARYLRITGGWANRHDVSQYRLVEIDRDRPDRVYQVPPDPRTGAARVRNDCAGLTFCTFDEEARNYANWLTYYSTRLKASIAVTAQALSQIETPIRLGFGRLGYYPNAYTPWPAFPSTRPPAVLPDLDGQPSPQHIERGVRPFVAGTSERRAMFDWLFQLSAVVNTHNREALNAAGEYYSRSDARGPWSDKPGTGPGGGQADLACRRSYTLLVTDGGWNDKSPPRRFGTYSTLWGSAPFDADSATGPTITGSGSQAGRSYTYRPALERAVSGTTGAQNNTFADAAFFYWSRDLRPDLPNIRSPKRWPGATGENYPADYQDPATWQNMTTMVIAYGLPEYLSEDHFLTQLRSGGGVDWPQVNFEALDGTKTADTQRGALVSRGNYYSANNADELASALNKVLQSLGARQSSNTGIAVSSATITTDDSLAFEASFDLEGWDGKLRAIGARSLLLGSPDERWTASFPTDWRTRKLVTTTGLQAGTNLRWANLSGAQQVSLLNQQNVDYIRGERSNEQPGGALRKRNGLLGTIVHSSPLYSKATNFGYQRTPSAGGVDYAGYLASKTASRRGSVLVGSNDGMLHAFDAETGVELFGFLPRAALGAMGRFSSTEYDHRYLVDGPLTEGDIHVGGGWKSVVVGSSGAGPKSLFALDITDPTAFSPAKVLFDMDASDEADLGHVMGRPLIASTAAGKWVAIVGNGYESSRHRAVLLVVDLESGAVLKKIDTGVGADLVGQRNGLGPLTPIYNARRDVVGVYGGDKLGNVWKFDLSSTTAADWKVATVGTAPSAPFFTATDAAGNRQPITSEIRVTEHPLGGRFLVFGTGKYFEEGDAATTTTQAIYAIRDVGDVASVSLGQLQAGILANVSGGDYRTVSGLQTIDWTTRRGWYLPLAVGTGTGTGAGTGGERIIAPPIISGSQVTFTSFRPVDVDDCTSGGTSYLYVFDLAAGFGTNVYENQAANVIGRKLSDGVPGGMIPLYAPPPSDGTMVSSIGLDGVKELVDNTRYTATSGGYQTGATGSLCAAAGTTMSQTPLAAPVQCAGTLPMRVWRDLR